MLQSLMVTTCIYISKNNIYNEEEESFVKFKMFKKVTGISALGLALGSVMTFGFSVVSADSKYIEKDGFLIN